MFKSDFAHVKRWHNIPSVFFFYEFHYLSIYLEYFRLIA